MKEYTISVNEKEHVVSAEEGKPLLWVLREELNLVGAKYGCGIGQCGACTVLLDGTPVRSCSLPISDIATARITTVEGIAAEVEHPILKAWSEENVPQCGFCQTGQIMSAWALLKENPNPSDEEIDGAMSGNYCRCGTYHRIRKAIKKASKM